MKKFLKFLQAICLTILFILPAVILFIFATILLPFLFLAKLISLLRHTDYIGVIEEIVITLYALGIMLVATIPWDDYYDNVLKNKFYD